MAKTPIYFIPGLAAGPEIFENLQFPKELYELRYLAWKNPRSANESIESYAQRMAADITHKNPVLVGVSFGGIIAQEISRLIAVEKIILISSIQYPEELPKKLSYVKLTKLYKLFPTKFFKKFEDYTPIFLNNTLKKRAEMYQRYLYVRNPDYIKWSIHAILNWKKNYQLNTELVHLHGTKDKIFPIKNIKNCIEIKNGTHVMILLKAKKIAEYIHHFLSL